MGGRGGSILRPLDFVGPAQELGSLATARSYHSLTIVGGQLVVAGGENEIASVETLNGREWIQTSNLKVRPLSGLPFTFSFVQ